MPTYEYKGHRFSSEEPLSEADWEQTLAYFDSIGPKKTKTSVAEDVGIGLSNLAHTGKTALDMLAGGVARIAGDEEGSDAIYDSMIKRQAAHDAEMALKEQGTGGKIISGVTGVAPAIGLGVLTGNPVLAAAAMGGMGALEGGSRNVQAGASTGGAVTQAIVEGAADTAAMALPVGRGALAGMGWGAGGNVASQGVADAAARLTMPEEAIQKNYALDPEKYAVQAAVGAVPGAVFGRMENKARTQQEQTDAAIKGFLDELNKPPTPEESSARLIKQNEDLLGIVTKKRDVLAEEKASSEAQLRNIETIEQQRALTEQELRNKENVTKDIHIKNQKLEDLNQELDGIQKTLKSEQIAQEAFTGKKEDPNTPPPPVEDVPNKPPTVDTLPDPITKPSEDPADLVDTILGKEETIDGPVQEPFNEKWKYSPTTDEHHQKFLAEVESGHFMKLSDPYFVNAFEARVARAKRLLDEIRWAEQALQADPRNEKAAMILENNGFKLQVLHEEINIMKGIKKQRDERSLLPQSYLDENAKSFGLDQALVDALRKGGIRNGLQHIIDTQPKSANAILAKALMDNENIKNWLILSDADGVMIKRPDGQDQVAVAVYDPRNDNGRATIALYKYGQNPRSLLHELVHSAVNRAFTFFRDPVMVKQLKFEERAAVTRINKLFATIGDQIPDLYKNAKSSVDEFVAEALTDTDLQHHLSKIHYSGESVLSKFVNDVAVALGLKDKVARTALAEVLGQTDVLIKNTTATHTSGTTRTQLYRLSDVLPTNQNMTSRISPAAIVQMINLGQISDMANKHLIMRNLFGSQQFSEIFRNAPLVREVYKSIEIVNRDSIRKAREWLHGIPTRDTSPTAFHPAVALSVKARDKSVMDLLPKAKAIDVEQVIDVLRKGFDHETTLMAGQTQYKFDYNDCLQMFGSHLNTHQRDIYNAVTTMFHRMATDTGIKNARSIWFPALRKGEFVVPVRNKNGNVIHLESFRTQAEADIFVRNVKNGGQYNPDPYIKLDVKNLGESFQIVQDALAMRGNNQQVLAYIDSVRQQIARNASLGSHEMHRANFTGYEGSQWFKTREQNAEATKQSIIDAANEFAALYRKRGISQLAEQYLNDPTIKSKLPNQVDVAKFMIDYAVNKHDKFPGVEQFDNYIRSTIDNGVVKMIDAINLKFGKNINMPKTSVFDRTHGVAAQLFYISALTTRPAFWAAQLLSSPFSIRHLLREGNALDVTVATSKGLWTALTGGDRKFREIAKFIADKGDSLHPQLVTDITSIGQKFLESHNHATIKALVDYATGQKPAAVSDSISRYITLAIGYEFYKDRFVNKAHLARQMEEFVDKTMIMYSRAHSSPVFDKAGIVGQGLAPLQKYAVGQLGNLIADMKLMYDAPGGKAKLAATLPFLSTMATSMLMGGVFGAVMIAEYEVLIQAIKWAGKQLGLSEVAMSQALPSTEKLILKGEFLPVKMLNQGYQYLGMEKGMALQAAQYGLVSAVSGFDIGSGLRFQPYVGNPWNDTQSSIMNALPVVNFIGQAAQNISVGMQYQFGGNVNKAEYRKSMMQFQPVVGGKYLVDKLMFDADTRPFVPEGKRGFGTVPQTDKEQAATLMGTSTMEKKELRNVYFAKNEQKKLNEQMTKVVDKILDQLENNETVTTDDLEVLAKKLGVTGSQLKNRLINTYKQRNMGLEHNWVVGADGKMSAKDAIKYNMIHGGMEGGD